MADHTSAVTGTLLLIGSSAYTEALAQQLAGAGVEVERGTADRAAALVQVAAPDLVVFVIEEAAEGSTLAQLGLGPVPSLPVLIVSEQRRATRMATPAARNVAVLQAPGGAGQCAGQIRRLIKRLGSEASSQRSLTQLLEAAAPPSIAASSPSNKGATPAGAFGARAKPAVPAAAATPAAAAPVAPSAAGTSTRSFAAVSGTSAQERAIGSLFGSASAVHAGAAPAVAGVQTATAVAVESAPTEANARAQATSMVAQTRSARRVAAQPQSGENLRSAARQQTPHEQPGLIALSSLADPSRSQTLQVADRSATKDATTKAAQSQAAPQQRRENAAAPAAVADKAVHTPGPRAAQKTEPARKADPAPVQKAEPARNAARTPAQMAKTAGSMHEASPRATEPSVSLPSPPRPSARASRADTLPPPPFEPSLPNIRLGIEPLPPSAASIPAPEASLASILVSFDSVAQQPPAAADVDPELANTLFADNDSEVSAPSRRSPRPEPRPGEPVSVKTPEHADPPSARALPPRAAAPLATSRSAAAAGLAPAQRSETTRSLPRARKRLPLRAASASLAVAACGALALHFLLQREHTPAATATGSLQRAAAQLADPTGPESARVFERAPTAQIAPQPRAASTPALSAPSAAAATNAASPEASAAQPPPSAAADHEQARVPELQPVAAIEHTARTTAVSASEPLAAAATGEADSGDSAPEPARHPRRDRMRARAAASQGQALLKHAQLGLAEAAYVRALKLLPSYPRAMAGLVRVHLARRDGAEALRWATRLIARQPNRGPYQLLLGDARAMDGDRSGARAAWTKAARYGSAAARRRLKQR